MNRWHYVTVPEYLRLLVRKVKAEMKREREAAKK